MQKDLKTGMILGLILVGFIMLWLFAGPGIGPNSIILNSRSNQEIISAPEKTTGPIIIADTRKEENFQQSSTTLSQSQEPEWKKYRTEEKIKTERFHIIREGETLSEISRTYYDSARKWQKIVEANRNIIKDVNKLKPGTKIIIPD